LNDSAFLVPDLSLGLVLRVFAGAAPPCMIGLSWREGREGEGGVHVMLVLMLHYWHPFHCLGFTHSAGRRLCQSHYSNLKVILYISSLNHPLFPSLACLNSLGLEHHQVLFCSANSRAVGGERGLGGRNLGGRNSGEVNRVSSVIVEKAVMGRWTVGGRKAEESCRRRRQRQTGRNCMAGRGRGLLLGCAWAEGGRKGNAGEWGEHVAR